MKNEISSSTSIQCGIAWDWGKRMAWGAKAQMEIYCTLFWELVRNWRIKVLAATSDVESLLIFRWLKTKWVLRFESRNENNSCHCWELAVVSLFFSHQIIFYDINSREQLNFPNLNFSHHRKGEKIHKLRPMIFNATFLVALSSICGCTPTHDGSFNLWWFVSLSGKIGFFLRCPEKFTTREKMMEPGGC